MPKTEYIKARISADLKGRLIYRLKQIDEPGLDMTALILRLLKKWLKETTPEDTNHANKA